MPAWKLATHVEMYAPAGFFNPASLTVPPDDSHDERGDKQTAGGTVNLIVGTTYSLNNAALANLLAVAVEAIAATLLAETNFSGTTTDAVIVGCEKAGERAEYSGSATRLGGSMRACVREAIRASLNAR